MAWTTATKTEAEVRAGLKALIGLPRFNVMDPAYGAVSDGVTDDQAAIKAAVDAVIARGGGTIFLPKGTGNYKLGSAVPWEDPGVHIMFDFEPGAKLIGNFADALLKRSVNSPIGGVHVVRNGRFENDHAGGKGLMMHSCVGGLIENCQFSGAGAASGANIAGIETYNSQSIIVNASSIIGFGVGIMAGNATAVLSTDITGCKDGIRHQNVGLMVHGGRFEVNTRAIVLGLNETGGAFTSSGVDIAGLSMESNGTAIYSATSANVSIKGISSGGGTGITLAYGLNLENISNALVAGVVLGAETFSGAGVRLSNANQLVMMGVQSNPGSGGGTPWDVAAPSRTTFFGCNLLERTTETGDATLDGSYHKLIYMNAGSANSLFVRADSYFGGDLPPIGHEYTVIQAGAGQTTIAADTALGAITLNVRGGRNKIAGQWGEAKLRKTGVSEWLLYGSDLTT